jgi:hypothetical protein
MEKAPDLAESALQAWNEIGNKIIAIAQDFPADKYDYKPTPEVRTYAEIVLHVAGADDIFTAAAQGLMFRRSQGVASMERARYGHGGTSRFQSQAHVSLQLDQHERSYHGAGNFVDCGHYQSGSR